MTFVSPETVARPLPCPRLIFILHGLSGPRDSFIDDINLRYSRKEEKAGGNPERGGGSWLLECDRSR